MFRRAGACSASAARRLLALAGATPKLGRASGWTATPRRAARRPRGRVHRPSIRSQRRRLAYGNIRCGVDGRCPHRIPSAARRDLVLAPLARVGCSFIRHVPPPAVPRVVEPVARSHSRPAAGRGRTDRKRRGPDRSGELRAHCLGALCRPPSTATNWRSGATRRPPDHCVGKRSA